MSDNDVRLEWNLLLLTATFTIIALGYLSVGVTLKRNRRPGKMYQSIILINFSTKLPDKNKSREQSIFIYICMLTTISFCCSIFNEKINFLFIFR